MKRCTVCGEIVADDVEICPVCKAKTFVPVEESKTVYVAEHHVGDGVVEDKEAGDGGRADLQALFEASLCPYGSGGGRQAAEGVRVSAGESAPCRICPMGEEGMDIPIWQPLYHCF